MYTATMNYQFKPENFDKACELWKHHVLQHARSQPGFVRMQFLTSSPRAQAIGTWHEKTHAEAFMKTGVFKNLMTELEDCCAESPVPQVWELRFFEQA